MAPSAPYLLALGIAVAAGGGLAAFLLLRCPQAPGARPLAAFLGLTALWTLGLALALPALLAVAPLGAVAFVLFACAVTGRRPRPRPHTLFILAVGVAVAGLGFGMGPVEPWPGIAALPHHQGGGLAVALFTAALAVHAHALLYTSWRRARGPRRRRIGSALASGLVGLAAVSPLALPLIGWQAEPWPLLALPLYPAVLVHGVVRHHLLEADLWARRAVLWGVLIILATVAAGGLGALSGLGGPTAAALATALALLAGGPLERLADRFVHPGARLEPALLADWRRVLAEADTPEQVSAAAGRLLAEHLRLPPGEPTPDWSQAPPGPRRVAAALADLQAEALDTLARRQAFAEQTRLAEIGALAATVAHDLRNPLGILLMATADADPVLRLRVREQVGRLEALVRDLLDYAKPWAVAPGWVDVASAIEQAASAAQRPSAEPVLPEGLSVWADAARLHQALVNLLTNTTPAATVVIEAEDLTDRVVIRVCDDGPGIPADIRPRLFQPFVSRSPQGTGLGLAIVGKVMAAHGGAARLEDRPGWSTCLRLDFPHPEAAP